MNRRPVAIALLACEHVIVEENTRNVTPVNCFIRRELRAGEPVSFTVVAFLTDGLGEINLEIVIQRQDNMEVLYRVGKRFRFGHPLTEYRAVFRLRDLPIPGDGSYELTLMADNELVATRVISLSRK